MFKNKLKKLGYIITSLSVTTAAFAQTGVPGCGPPVDVPEINGASQAIAAALFVGGALVYYERKRRLSRSESVALSSET